MLIKNFVKGLNSFLPSVESVVEKYKTSFDKNFTSEDGRQYLIDNTCHYNGPGDSDRIEDLIYCTNISSINTGAIRFRKQLKEIKSGYQEFARYNDFYHISLKGNSIVILGEVDDSVDEFFANSLNDFLEFVLEYIRLDRKLVFNMPFNFSNSIKVLEVLKTRGLSESWSKAFLSEFEI